MKEKRKKVYCCPKCGLRSRVWGRGVCVSCGTRLKKLCECDSGRFAKECCRR